MAWSRWSGGSEYLAVKVASKKLSVTAYWEDIQDDSILLQANLNAHVFARVREEAPGCYHLQFDSTSSSTESFRSLVFLFPVRNLPHFILIPLTVLPSSTGLFAKHEAGAMHHHGMPSCFTYEGSEDPITIRVRENRQPNRPIRIRHIMVYVGEEILSAESQSNEERMKNNRRTRQI